MKISRCCKNKLFKDQYSQERCLECLLLAKPVRRVRNWLIMLFGAILLTCGFSTKENSSPNIGIYKNIEEDSCQDVPLNDSCILRELIKDSCISPTLIVTQFKLETHNYTSELCLKYHNLGGVVYHPCKYVIGNASGWAIYKDYKSCLKCHHDIEKLYLKNAEGVYFADKEFS